ncbi:MAG: hypothetical protein ACK4FS_03420, partial [Flavobacterium sp.]
MMRTLFFNPSFLLSFSYCSKLKGTEKKKKYFDASFWCAFLLLAFFSFSSAPLLAQNISGGSSTIKGDIGVQPTKPSLTPSLNPTLINVAGVVLDDPSCSKTYTYTRCWTTPALSHFVLGLPTCITPNNVVGVYINGQTYNNWTINVDPTCGAYGLKWDNLNLGSNTCAEFKVVFNESYVPHTTLGYNKAGPNCVSSPTTGPSCETCNPCPDNCRINGALEVCPGSVDNMYFGPKGDFQYSWSISGLGASINGSV